MKFSDLIKEHLGDWTPKVVFEIGACYGDDSLRLAEMLPSATVYSFEPNPITIPLAQANALKNPRICFTPKAVSEVNGVVEFCQSQTANAGYSSLLTPSGKYDVVEPMPVNKITVESVRLDTFMEKNNIHQIDAMWLDAQGGELTILKSMGSHISKVKAIWTEFCYDELYAGQPLFDDLRLFLEANGLQLMCKMDVLRDATGKWWWGDAFFARV